ncbi:hypothetical protein ALC57_11395 [Trachymyrmex cornetzi]|uniref:Uncharacterized protein n=1 Tax=Trachymyrmex cornetzi TaxID=471704 RepID=A0A151J2N2_9HYME|nr:hypothetical protein ALC57_11395 [Trachymyrmex cornetzi]
MEGGEGDGVDGVHEGNGRKNKILGVIEKERGKERKVRGWWDRERREKKERVRRVLREWRKGNGKGMEYKKEKREYKELCEVKKREENERWERKVEGARNESQVWEIVNGERKRRKGINKGIEMKEWEGYFKEWVGGGRGGKSGKGKR